MVDAATAEQTVALLIRQVPRAVDTLSAFLENMECFLIQICSIKVTWTTTSRAKKRLAPAQKRMVQVPPLLQTTASAGTQLRRPVAGKGGADEHEPQRRGWLFSEGTTAQKAGAHQGRGRCHQSRACQSRPLAPAEGGRPGYAPAQQVSTLQCAAQIQFYYMLCIRSSARGSIEVSVPSSSVFVQARGEGTAPRQSSGCSAAQGHRGWSSQPEISPI